MSAIPPPIIGSAIQASVAQREASRPIDSERAGRSHAARDHARAVDAASSNVETTDGDTQVFSDSEGAGGQGRAFGDQDTGTASPEPESGSETAGPGGGALDVRA